MSDADIKKIVGKVFNQIAEGLETGSFGKRTRVGLTTLGSEHGTRELVNAARMAVEDDPSIEVVLIGDGGGSTLETYETDNQEEMHARMEELLDKGEIDCCVTLHYNFPVGVSTVGKVVTPGTGREMYIATTTGTSAVDRVEAMVKNAIYGIITAKTMGITNPTVGILNVDGARQTERILKQLNQNGYHINFTESLREDGGFVMRGNDLLAGTPDIMVTDTLTGNLLIKIFSSYTTGGSYEAAGYGYGPGIGEDYSRIVLIISRASGAPLIANAIRYGAKLARGNMIQVAAAELETAKKAGLGSLISRLRTSQPKQEAGGGVEPPPKKVVDATISGIDILDLDSATEVLWKNDVYAETGMGCTGPVIMVAGNDLEKAIKLLGQNGYIAQESEC